MPTFSVIVPTFNAAGTILGCLESVACQTHADYEIVVQDGLSTDGTAEVVDAFQHSHAGVDLRLYRERDRSVYEAMNKALDRTRGEWVLFLGSDDRLYAPDTLERVAASLTAQDDVVYGDVVSTRFAGRYAGRFSIEGIGRRNICHQAIFCRRTVFDLVGRFDVRFRLLADWEHNMRWFLSPAVRARYVSEVIARYADGGVSSHGTDKAFELEQASLYLRYGRHSVPLRVKARVVMREFERAIRRREWPRLTLALRSCSFLFSRCVPVAR